MSELPLNHWHFYPNPCIYLMNHDKEKKKNMWRIENLRYLQWFSLMEFADVYVPKAYKKKTNKWFKFNRSFNILPQIFILQLPPSQIPPMGTNQWSKTNFQSSSCHLCCTELVSIKVVKSFFRIFSKFFKKYFTNLPITFLCWQQPPSLLHRACLDKVPSVSYITRHQLHIYKSLVCTGQLFFDRGKPDHFWISLNPEYPECPEYPPSLIYNVRFPSFTSSLLFLASCVTKTTFPHFQNTARVPGKLFGIGKIPLCPFITKV